MNYVKEYIDKIKSGEIVVSKKVRKLYLNIIEPIINDNHPVYRFNEELGEVFIDFAQTLCKQSKGDWAGSPIELMLFQRAKYQSVFGIVERETGKRRFKQIFDVRGRKNGKSTENSVLGLYLTIIEPGAEVYAAATTSYQARRVWEESQSMVQQSKSLTKHFGFKVFPNPTIYTKKGKAYYKVLSKNVSTFDGLNVSAAIIDEVHELPRSIYDILIQATSARDEWLISMISTAGFVRKALFDDMYEYAEKVLDGIIEAPAFFPLIYELDNVDEMFDEDMWIKANPGIGVIKKVESLRENVEQMKSDMNFANTVKTKDFNIRGVENRAWLSFDDINNEDKYTEEELMKFKNSVVIGSFDLSRTTDMTAVNTLIFDTEKKRPIAITMYWVTQKFLDDQKRPDQMGNYVPWDQWIERGLVRVSGTNAIDYHDIANYFVSNHKKYGWIYQYINYDSWSANYLVEELASMGFARDTCLIPTPQGYKTLSVPMQTLETDLKEKFLCYQNNDVTKWCFTNVEMIADRNGNIMPKKVNDQRHRKIDGMAAILNTYVSFCANRDYYLGNQ
jgi:phage terminase large subunit-like protein